MTLGSTGERRASSSSLSALVSALLALAFTSSCTSPARPDQDDVGSDADTEDVEPIEDLRESQDSEPEPEVEPVDTSPEGEDSDGSDVEVEVDVGATTDGGDSTDDSADTTADADVETADGEVETDSGETSDLADADVDVVAECTSDLHCDRLEVCEGTVCLDRAGAACVAHGECGFGGACQNFVCVDRRTVRGAVELSPLTTLISEHFMSFPGAREPFGNGRGGAVLDYDGDGLLDLFVGGIREVGTPACLYRNVSGDEVAFEATELCEVLPRVDGAAATDLDRDGVHELATFAVGSVNHWSWDGEEWRTTDLYPLIEAAGLGCSAGGGTMLDADRDGDLDLLVHCQHDGAAVPLGFANVVLEVEDGMFVEAWSTERAEALADNGLTLAVLVSDLNEDGLTDLVVLDDTFSSDGVVNLTWEPGGVVWGCSPLEECEWRGMRLGPGTNAWGSFMGAASVRLFDGTELVYLTDLGLDRLVNVADGEIPDDEAEARGVSERPRDTAIFSWGAFTEDLDQNGLDDIFVITGDGIPPRIAGGVDIGHIDRHLMQTTEGFEPVFRPVFAPESEPVFPGRFCAAVDFNTDGLLEFVTTPFIGNVRMETESLAEWGGLRAALIPTTRVVHQLGARFEVWSESGWQRRATHGQPRSTSSPYLTVPEGRVRLRFPSGGVLETFVEGPGPHEVVEPDWLGVSRETGMVRVSVDPEHWEGPVEHVSIAHRTDERTTLVELSAVEDHWEGIAEGGVVMVRINDRWVERWWP